MLNDVLNNPAIWRASALHQQQSLGSNLMPQGIDTGFPMLNEKLAGAGWPLNGVTEILYDRQGEGEVSLLLPALRLLSEQDRWIIWIAPPHCLQAPALAAAGVNIQRLLLIHPRSGKDCLWSTEEALKSGAASAVLCWPGQVKPEQVRRLQIVSVQHRTPCFLFLEEGTPATPCALRVHIQSLDQEHSTVRILKRKRGWPLEPFSLQIRKCPSFRYQKHALTSTSVPKTASTRG